MNKTNYIEMLPLSRTFGSRIAKYPKNQPKDAVPFIGYPRVHHSEKDKIILVYDPLSAEPVVMEFILEDILFVEEVSSAVTESGEGVPMVKLWVRKGAVGMILEPFEVDANRKFDPAKVTGKVRAIKERILKSESRKNRPQAST